MSAKLMGMVFELDLTGPPQIIMLCLADHARDDGASIYPSIGYLAWKTGCSERTIQRTLRELESTGLLERTVEGRGRGVRNEWTIHISKGVRKSPYIAVKGDSVTPILAVDNQEKVSGEVLKGDTAVAPEPLEPSVVCVPPTSEHIRAVPKPARVDPIWDAFVLVIGNPPETKSERGAWNEAVGQLRKIAATPVQIVERSQRYRREWPKMKLTPTALVRHWSEFGSASPTEYEPPVWNGWKD